MQVHKAAIGYVDLELKTALIKDFIKMNIHVHDEG